MTKVHRWWKSGASDRYAAKCTQTGGADVRSVCQGFERTRIELANCCYEEAALKPAAPGADRRDSVIVPFVRCPSEIASTSPTKRPSSRAVASACESRNARISSAGFSADDQ